MLNDFNLLATTYRGSEEDLCSEIWYLLREIGDETAQVEKTGIKGLITAKTALNPFEAIKKLRDMLKKHPSEFRYALRIIPIETVITTNPEEIKEAVTKLALKIGEDETIRVTIEKRFTTHSSKEIIEAAVANVERKVDLGNPDKSILLEVIGKLTGISIIEPNDIINVTKEKTS